MEKAEVGARGIAQALHLHTLHVTRSKLQFSVNVSDCEILVRLALLLISKFTTLPQLRNGLIDFSCLTQFGYY